MGFPGAPPPSGGGWEGGFWRNLTHWHLHTLDGPGQLLCRGWASLACLFRNLRGKCKGCGLHLGNLPGVVYIGSGDPVPGELDRAQGPLRVFFSLGCLGERLLHSGPDFPPTDSGYVGSNLASVAFALYRVTLVDRALWPIMRRVPTFEAGT